MERGPFLQQPLLAVTTNAEEQLLVPLKTLRSRAFPAGRSLAHPREMEIDPGGLLLLCFGAA